MIELFENPENYPSANELLNEIKECKEPDQIPILVDKLTEVMKLGVGKFGGGNPKHPYIRKWAKKLEPLTTNEGITACAILLENQYRVINDFDQDHKEAKRKLEQLKKSIADMPENIREIVLKQVAIDQENLPKKHTDYFPYRGVNVYDEIVKAYDSCLAKELVGFQPILGPVGLGYVMRFRNNERKKPTRTKKELLEEYNKLAEQDFGKMSPCKTWEELPDHLVESFRKDYHIDGLEYKEEIGLTIEQKEIRADSQDIKLRGKKFSYEDIQLNWDTMVLNKILEDCPVVEKVEIHGSGDIDSLPLRTAILTHAEDIAQETKMGPGNVVVSGIDIDVPDTIKHIKVGGELAKILGNKVILAHHGGRESSVGFVLCPYNPLGFSKAIGKEEIDPRKIFSRNGLINIQGGEKYYRVLEVKG